MKYKKGEFGYWWIVINGNKDIEGKVYAGSISCRCSSLVSLKGAPKEVVGGFYCNDNALTTLKGAPEKVGGNFYCSGNALTSLKGAPEKVGGYFDCYKNALTSLKGAPKEVGDGFDCSYNKLTSLKGAPEKVGGYFYCYNNALTSLEGAPKEVCGNFYCYNNALTSLKGAPEKVGGYFDCAYNKLTSLKGAPKEVGSYFACNDNALTSLKGAPEKVGDYFDCAYNKLTSLKGAPKEVGGYFVCSGNQQLKELLDNMPTQAICGDVYKWCGKIWSFFDGVQKEIATIRKSGSITVCKMKDGTYAMHDGEAYAHGETLKEAKADLIFKRTSRDLSEYKELTLDSKLTLAECIKMYRSITGACSLGTKEFCSKRKLKKAYTVREVIEITDGAYGNERLKEFFGKEANDHNR